MFKIHEANNISIELEECKRIDEDNKLGIRVVMGEDFLYIIHYSQRPGTMKELDQLRKLNTVAQVVKLKSFWELAGDDAWKLGMALGKALNCFLMK